jgi:hypothetical protein
MVHFFKIYTYTGNLICAVILCTCVHHSKRDRSTPSIRGLIQIYACCKPLRKVALCRMSRRGASSTRPLWRNISNQQHIIRMLSQIPTVFEGLAAQHDEKLSRSDAKAEARAHYQFENDMTTFALFFPLYLSSTTQSSLDFHVPSSQCSCCVNVDWKEPQKAGTRKNRPLHDTRILQLHLMIRLPHPTSSETPRLLPPHLPTLDP